MRGVCRCVVALTLLAVVVRAQAPARDTPPATAGTGVIRGRVTLAGTDQPLPRVDVRASSPALKTPRAVKSDNDGRYEIADLLPGRYVVSAVKANFVTAAFGQRRPLGPGLPFDLAAKQIASRVDFALARAGVITGRILDEFGDPMPDVLVTTLRYQYVNGERRLANGPGRGQTNDVGEFRLFGLPPGDYFVSATLRNFMTNDPGDRSGYAPTYYPGTGSAQQAQRIAIAPGQTVSGLAMTLLPVRTVRVSGMALDAAGKPVEGGMVMATPRVGMMGMATQMGQILRDGRFYITGVTPGDYMLRINNPRQDQGSSAFMPITVGDSDITDLQLAAQPLGSIRGRVVFDTDAGLPKSADVRISAQRRDPLIGIGPLGGSANDDLTFDIKVVPGHAIIRGGQPSNAFRFKRVTLNGEDVSDSGVDIPPGGAVSNLVIEFTSKLNELEGTIIEAADGATDAWAVIFSQDARKLVPPSRFVVAARPDRENHFRMRLMAGDYFAIVVDDVEPNEWTDPDYLARVRERATPFSIADGEKKTIELKLSSSR
jgi:hypothetical protein